MILLFQATYRGRPAKAGRAIYDELAALEPTRKRRI